jgi:hypothetical protein
MSAFSDADIIAQNPIGNGLDSFRQAFTSSYEDVDFDFPNSVEDVKPFTTSSGNNPPPDSALVQLTLCRREESSNQAPPHSTRPSSS